MIRRAILRILYCSENYCPHDHRFLSALGKSAHEVFWLRLEQGGRPQETRPIPSEIQVVDWRRNSAKTTWMDYPSLKKKFQRVLQVVKPDLVHAGPIQRVAILPALVNFHPLLSMSWGFDLLEHARKNVWWRGISRFVLQRSDWFAADCETVHRIAIELGLAPARTTIFPWGVDLQVFQPQTRGFMRCQVGYEEDLLIIHTRSWEARYGIDIALEGFWRAFQQVKNIRLFMLGGGSQEKQIHRFIEERGLQERVHFCGYHQNEDLAKYYQAGDLYLSASHIDGSSVALLESMACGCPALVSDIPSNLEWIQAGREGWTFRDSDAQDLAKTIINISQEKSELQKRGALARRKAEKDADWNKNFKKLLQTYQSIV